MAPTVGQQAKHVSVAVTVYRVCGQLQAIGEAISLSCGPRE